MAEKGRGRLPTLNRLPEKAQPLRRKAEKQLAADRMTQGEIRDELNAGLRDIGVPEISSSSFNRYSQRMSQLGRDMKRRREAMAAYVAEVGERPNTQQLLVISEIGKNIICDTMEKGFAGEIDISPKDLAALALSYQRFSSGDERAMKASDAQVELDDKISKKEAERILDAATRHAGLSARTSEFLKGEILGVKKRDVEQK